MRGIGSCDLGTCASTYTQIVKESLISKYNRQESGYVR